MFEPSIEVIPVWPGPINSYVSILWRSMPEIHNTEILTPDKFKAELVFEYLKDFIWNTEKTKFLSVLDWQPRADPDDPGWEGGIQPE